MLQQFEISIHKLNLNLRLKQNQPLNLNLRLKQNQPSSLGSWIISLDEATVNVNSGECTDTDS